MHMFLRFTVPLFSAIIAVCAVSVSSQVSAKEYYKWVDRNGSTHYTTTPPPKNARHQGKVDTYGASRNSSAPAAQSESQTAAEPTAPVVPAPPPVSNNQPVIEPIKEPVADR